MVLRKGLKKALSGTKQAKKSHDEDRSTRKMGGRRVQKKGELDLTNPIIPSGLDEDIDDDLAFNSEDEERFGAFFAKKDTSKKSKKRQSEKAVSEQFDRLNAVGENHEDFGDGGFSDDSRDEIDLSEMLDSKDDRRKSKASRRNKREGRRNAPEDKLTREQESLLGPIDYADDGKKVKKPAGLHELLHSAPATTGVNRLESALKSRKNLLVEDVDDLTKEKTARSQTREKMADNLKKYSTVLKLQKEAAHLKFPLSVPDSNPVPGTIGSLANALSKQRSTSASEDTMANRMHDLLKSSGLGSIRSRDEQNPADGEHVKFGEGEDEGHDQEEPRINVGYMAKLKSMMGYELAKRRRLNKIKSKTYRRILRKEKDRDEERRQKALELLDPDAARARLREKMEKMRAEERATQKHKNTSKWVKHAKQFAKFDTNTKDAIDEQHVLRQRLMAKMDEEADADVANAADAMSESSEEEMRVDELLAGKKDAESILWQSNEEGVDNANLTPVQKSRKELLQMGFMVKAKERSEVALKKELEELKEDIERYRQGEELAHAPAGMLTKGKKKARNAIEDEVDADIREEVAADDAAETGKAIARRSSAPKTSIGTVVKGAGRLGFAESNKHKQHDVALQVRAGISVASATPMDDDTIQATDGAIELDNAEETWPDEDTEFAGARTDKKRNKKVSSSTRVQVPIEAPKKRVREEDPVTIATPAEEHDPRALQEYLIARAFAMDDIDEDFKKLKEAQVESVMKPEDRNASLPGWGEWGGTDERLNKQHKERVEAKSLERRIAKTTLMKARADAHLDNVIINHDVDLVPDRHTLHMVPRPFSNPTEFARSMRQPMGPEWNTSLTFKEGTQPRITTTQGVAIDPLDLTSQKKKAKTIRRKMSKKE